LRQVVEHVALPMKRAALHYRQIAEDVLDSRALT
jgi:hypothetical protein